jgi:hypothetical protein
MLDSTRRYEVQKRKVDSEAGLRKTLNLLAIVSLDGKKLKDQVSLMARAGFERVEMAEILGTTPNSISVRLNELKKAAGDRRGRSGKSSPRKEKSSGQVSQ